MSITNLIGPYLPMLRRYARALTGFQASGDAYVVAVLEMLVADPNVFDRGIPPREALYSLFSRIWNAMPLTDRLSAEQEDTAPAAMHDQRIEAISPLPRQAFLLTAVEGFSNERGRASCVCRTASSTA